MEKTVEEEKAVQQVVVEEKEEENVDGELRRCRNAIVWLLLASLWWPWRRGRREASCRGREAAPWRHRVPSAFLTSSVSSVSSVRGFRYVVYASAFLDGDRGALSNVLAICGRGIFRVCGPLLFGLLSSCFLA